MGKLSRDKGKRGEREVAKLFQEFGFSARRGQQFRGGPGSPDVVVEDLPMPFHVEVKYQERLDLEGALYQARTEAPEGSKPIVFHRKNGTDWRVTFSARDFLLLLFNLQSWKDLYEEEK